LPAGAVYIRQAGKDLPDAPPNGLASSTRRPLGTRLAETTGQPHRVQGGSETIMADSLFGIHGMALELRAQRLGVLTSNIANAGTPGYKARDIDFGGALKAMTQGASVAQAVGTATQYRVPVMPALDGNTVEMSTEQTAFAENAIGYEATLNMLQDRVQTVTRALKGE
jgi:flagellar basal-body rod protein FlgB